MDFIPLVIKEIREETDVYQSIIFTKPKEFTFMLGECFSFRFPGEDSSKVFSFASSPTENVIIISYKKGVSAFKKKLENLQVGDSMEISLYGSQFQFKVDKRSFFIAGGIGITAFRSIITYCIDRKITSSIHLLFINKTDVFPFKKELDVFSTTLPNFSVTYIATNTEGRLTKERMKKILSRINDEVYIAGPPLMIDNTTELLRECGVKEKYIHTESFDGYTEEN